LIGEHQQGFIPGRDGRENIINVQLIIDLINAKNEEGAMVFLTKRRPLTWSASQPSTT
jgi:hypothetical protein